MSKERLRAAALQYRHGLDAAPKVTAKGAGKVAEKIIDIAREYGIPIREDKDLVEVLSSLDLHQEIPPELYRAVAEILAFVYFLNQQEKKT